MLTKHAFSIRFTTLSGSSWPMMVLATIVAISSMAADASSKDQWRSVADDALTDRQVRQKQEAHAAQAALGGQLMAKLLAAVGKESSVGAIAVCKTEARKIAHEVGKKHRLKIGRTSFKLRNPANTPPIWAKQAVDKKVAKPMYFSDDAGRFGVLLPIHLQPLCTSCHGGEKQIDPAVNAALKKAYPKDQATGFQVGELRGWFWIEVPVLANDPKPSNETDRSGNAATHLSKGAPPHHGRGHGGPHKGAGQPMRAHEAIHFLLEHHKDIQRSIKEIPGGVETITTSEKVEVAKQIQKHVAQMKQRIESGHAMRRFDPLFVEIFKHYKKIKMTIKNIPGGVKVTETSDDPKVTLLIRKHAATVSEFVRKGMERAHQPTKLPKGYEKTK